jgi:uncharacterized Tic20 family protein
VKKQVKSKEDQYKIAMFGEIYKIRMFTYQISMYLAFFIGAFIAGAGSIYARFELNKIIVASMIGGVIFMLILGLLYICDLWSQGLWRWK